MKEILLTRDGFKVLDSDKKYNYNEFSLLIGDTTIAFNQKEEKGERISVEKREYYIYEYSVKIDTIKDIHLIYPENPFKEKTEDE